MPNSKLPIQRASRICETKAIAAEATRMMKAAPARRRTREESLPSANSAWARPTAPLICSPHGTEDDRRQDERQTGRGACSEPIDATNTSAPPPAGARDAAIVSKEPLTFGWKKLTITQATRYSKAGLISSWLPLARALRRWPPPRRG